VTVLLLGRIFFIQNVVYGLLLDVVYFIAFLADRTIRSRLCCRVASVVSVCLYEMYGG